jgi:hypothetical protein
LIFVVLVVFSGYSDFGASIFPKLVQLVIVPFEGTENVDYDIHVVEEDPSGLGGTLLMRWENFVFLQSLGDGIDNSPDLRGTFASADDKIVRKITDAPGIQKDNIRGLLIANDIDNFMSQF